MRVVVLLVLMASGAMSAEGATLPANVTKDLNDYRQRIDKISQDAEKKKSDETAKITKTLDEYIKAETKKGNLDGAIAIKKARDDLAAAPAASGENLLGDRIDAPVGGETQVVGFWRMDNSTTWDVKPGGVLIRTHADGTQSECSWKTVEGKVLFVYENGREWPLVRVDRRQLVVLKNGQEFKGEREAAPGR